MNSEDSDQSVHPQCLISLLVVCMLFLAAHKVPSEDSGQISMMPRLFAGRKRHFVGFSDNHCNVKT